jgi:hypothetical protein
MTDAETDEKLRLIAEAIEKAQGDPKKEAQYIDAIIDPQDANACEGCQ